jgi:prepilin-type N-terminal cleavage/methylation domain-containing protein
MSTCKAAGAKGFTLVELLTVVAVIALLAAILFTMFARVRENGRRAVCQSNCINCLHMQQYVQATMASTLRWSCSGRETLHS